MPRIKPDLAPIFFADAAAFREWLKKHAATTLVLTVGFYKVGSGRPSLSWPESVDEALSFGWIDGVRKRIDELAYQIRFTPRKTGSIWSTLNIARATALVAEGRMTAAGLQAFAHRSERKSGVYSYEQAGTLNFSAEELKAFKMNKAAWAYFENAAPSYRKTMLHWLVSAKQQATRARRLSKLVESCAAGVRLLP